MQVGLSAVLTITTNRDLYRVLTTIVEDHPRSLEDFLRVLHERLMALRDLETIPPDAFVRAVHESLTQPVPSVPDSWRSEDLSVDGEAAPDAGTVDRVLRSQILDLRDAAATGAVGEEWRYFGEDVPRPDGDGARATSSRWANWDSESYVECGLAGSFGGWESDDDDTEDPEGEGEIERPAEPLVAITWERLGRFLWAGQCHE